MAETASDVAGIVQRIEASPLRAEIGAILEIDSSSPPESADLGYTIQPPGTSYLAGDGAGGEFRVLSDGRILLIDSEGSYGILAPNFQAFVGMATGLPGWRDALRFVGEPDLGQARRNWADFARQWRLEQALDEPWPYEGQRFATATPGKGRVAIREAFGAPAIADPFAALHRAVNETSGDISVSWNGEPLLLFGRAP